MAGPAALDTAYGESDLDHKLRVIVSDLQLSYDGPAEARGDLILNLLLSKDKHSENTLSEDPQLSADKDGDGADEDASRAGSLRRLRCALMKKRSLHFPAEP